MEDRFDNKDFEQFLKQNADQYRMFPSEKLWNDIHHALHGRRRWYGIGLALLLLTTAVVTWVMLLNPSGEKKQVAANSPVQSTRNITEQSQQPEVLIVQPKSTTDNNNIHTPSTPKQQNLFFASANTEPIDITDNQSDMAETIRINPVPALPQQNIVSNNQPSVISKSSPAQNKEIQTNPVLTFTKQTDVSKEMDSSPNLTLENSSVSDKQDYKLSGEENSYPLSIESVVNLYKHTRKRKSLSWQIYVVPTISYRSLKENMAFIRAARSNGTIPTSTLPPEINKAVTHKPDLGFEVGFHTGYPVSKNFKIIGGLQFNVSKYDIRAYFNYQSEVATIALNSGNGANSVSTISNYRNYGTGTKANWLRNLYFSASAPVGAEIVFNSARKTYMGFSTTIQPTYIISNKAYLLSTDYKNYAEVPSLTRKWNLNTGFEVFAGYSTGKVQWRIGPQIRYQTLSSFQDKYPVREHLFDFGLKVGVMLK